MVSFLRDCQCIHLAAGALHHHIVKHHGVEPLNYMYASSDGDMPDTKLIPGQSLCPSCHSEYKQYNFSTCLSYLFNTCLVNTVTPELDDSEIIIDQGCKVERVYTRHIGNTKGERST